MGLHLRSATEDDARAMSGWRYAGPHAAVEPPPLDALLDGSTWALASESGELLGRVVVGEAARAPDVRYRDDALDLGLALRPDLAGRGQGVRCLQAVVAEVVARFAPRRLRATIEDWNTPALRICRQLGFRTVFACGGFRRQGGAQRQVLVLEVTAPPPERDLTSARPAA